MSLVNKVIAITGGASGIGFATAKILASRGAKLSIADINKENLAEAEKFFKDAGTSCLATVLDVTKSADVNAWIEATIKQFGRLDGAANCAGIGNPRQRPIIECEDEDWHEVQKVNLDGVFFCLRAELRVISEGGSIVNIASVAGLKGFPTQVSYGASKHGVVSLSKTAAMESGPRNVRVNAVAPGYIDTPLTRSQPIAAVTGELLKAWVEAAPMKRAGTADEVGQMVTWLISPESSFVTGAVHAVDGGMMA